ncbi:MAG: hypothetical protein H0T42_32830 [Deltaproteobacteria bacterium]|nr:hypothetical protein [Deltaproteobacteria bacterium]
MAGRFLVAAAAVLIALLVGLWFLLKVDDDAVVVTAPPTEEPVVVAPPTKPVGPNARPATRTQIPPVVLKRPTPSGTPTPGTPASVPSVTEDAPAKPPQIAEALKDQVKFTENQILECNEKASKAGKRLHGEAAFGWTIARSNGKIVIESTNTEYTNFDQPTTDCLREAANAMVFDALPDGVEALTAYRRINFIDGALERQALSDYRVTRPPPPPKP